MCNDSDELVQIFPNIKESPQLDKYRNHITIPIIKKTMPVNAISQGHLVMLIDEEINEKREEILRIAASHGARNVRIFGSVARGDADESSDIDFLVEMEPNRNLLDLGALLTDLRELMGRRVDVVSEKGLYWLLRRRILKEAKPL